MSTAMKIINADSQAILVFAAVMVVFLPLSFITSYCGMTLRGIQNMSLDESHFWKVCGSIALLVVLDLWRR